MEDEQVKAGSGIQKSRVKLNKTALEDKLSPELPTLAQEQLVDMREQRGTGEEEGGGVREGEEDERSKEKSQVTHPNTDKYTLCTFYCGKRRKHQSEPVGASNRNDSSGVAAELSP